MYNDDSKMTYAIIAILVIVLAGIAYYLRSNSIDNIQKANVTVPVETKTVDTKKFNPTATTTATTTTTTTSTTTNTTKATTTMDTTNLPKVVKGALIRTSMGDIEVSLDVNTKKETVTNFVTLVVTNFYEGIRFHRVIKGFMIQAGDPLTKDPSKKDAWGTGGPGYTIKDELTGKETYPQGTLAMARTAAPNSGGSQFFIVTAQSAPLPPDYTVFGKVIKGLDVALKIENAKTDSSDRPLEDIIIESIEIK